MRVSLHQCYANCGNIAAQFSLRPRSGPKTVADWAHLARKLVVDRQIKMGRWALRQTRCAIGNGHQGPFHKMLAFPSTTRCRSRSHQDHTGSNTNHIWTKLCLTGCEPCLIQKKIKLKCITKP